MLWLILFVKFWTNTKRPPVALWSHEFWALRSTKVWLLLVWSEKLTPHTPKDMAKLEWENTFAWIIQFKMNIQNYNLLFINYCNEEFWFKKKMQIERYPTDICMRSLEMRRQFRRRNFSAAISVGGKSLPSLMNLWWTSCSSENIVTSSFLWAGKNFFRALSRTRTRQVQSEIYSFYAVVGLWTREHGATHFLWTKSREHLLQ